MSPVPEGQATQATGASAMYFPGMPGAMMAPSAPMSAVPQSLDSNATGMNGIAPVLGSKKDFYEGGANQNQDDLRLVSLGSYCGPKLSFRKLGRDAETLPFDWMRSRVDGIVDFLQNDFDKFFHYDTVEKLSENAAVVNSKMFRSYYHSFWHDDLTDPADVEKLRRRISRFNAIDAHSKPVLFVRAVASNEECQHLGTLLDVLMRKFGRFAKLLAIVDFQIKEEPLVVQGLDNLLIYNMEHHIHSGHLGDAPYVKPIAEGITWAKTGRIEGARSIQSLTSESFFHSRIAWAVPYIFDPFEEVPSGGMKPLAPSAGGAQNGLQSLPFQSNNLAPQLTSQDMQPVSLTQGQYTSMVVPPLQEASVNLSRQATAANGLQQQRMFSQYQSPQVAQGMATPRMPQSCAFTQGGVQSWSAGKVNSSMGGTFPAPVGGLVPSALSPWMASYGINPAPASFLSASSCAPSAGSTRMTSGGINPVSFPYSPMGGSYRANMLF
jgi:hypothetical protein